jgi:hypothetical protein
MLLYSVAHNIANNYTCFFPSKETWVFPPHSIQIISIIHWSRCHRPWAPFDEQQSSRRFASCRILMRCWMLDRDILVVSLGFNIWFNENLMGFNICLMWYHWDFMGVNIWVIQAKTWDLLGINLPTDEESLWEFNITKITMSCFMGHVSLLCEITRGWTGRIWFRSLIMFDVF